MAKPTDLPQQPTNVPVPKNKKAGLSLGSTVGIGIGIALVVIISSIIAWIIVRRRRRKWGKARTDQEDPSIKDETPDQEIAKKVEGEKYAKVEAEETRAGEVVEMGDREKAKAELAGEDVKEIGCGRSISELCSEQMAYEMPTTQQDPVEIGNGGMVVAELDGTAVSAEKAGAGDKHGTNI